jgi:methionyl-tRNA formyltransferase
LGDSLPPGTLLHRSSGAAMVACGAGFLKLEEVQMENRKRTSAVDFLHGIRLEKTQSILLGT